MGDLVDEFEKWRQEGEEFRRRLVERRDVLREELERVNERLASLGVPRPVGAESQGGKLGHGTVQRNGRGWRWQIRCDGRSYAGPTVADREDAEAGRVAAVAAIAKGEAPSVAGKIKTRPRAETPPLPPAEVESAAAAPVPAEEEPPAAAEDVAPDVARPAARRAPPKPPRPHPDRILAIAASADRTGIAGSAAVDFQSLARGIGKLPPRLANVARRRWLRGQATALIARELDVREDAVVAMLEEARQLAGVAAAA